MNKETRRFAKVMLVGSFLEIFGLAYGLFNRSWAGLAFMISGWLYKLANGIIYEIQLPKKRLAERQRIEALMA